MTKDLFRDVGNFHAKFGLDYHPAKSEAAPLTTSVFDFRDRFMAEELNELCGAHDAGDLAGMADALADLVWVALGTAHLMGLDFGRVWDEVARANMAKERSTGADDPRSKRGHALDVVKPAGWVPPDHSWLK